MESITPSLLETSKLQAIRSTLAALPPVSEADEWQGELPYLIGTSRRLLAHIAALENQQSSVAHWLLGMSTGVSSQAIVARSLGVKPRFPHHDHPYDSGDFGRCYRMLRACPSISIECMVGASPTWDRLVVAWPTLEKLYERITGSQSDRAFQTALDEALQRNLA